MENKKTGLVIVLVIIIAVLCLVIGWLLGSKFADKESEILTNSNNTEEKEEKKDNEENNDLKQIINCTGTFSHQYGEATQEKKYIFNNNVLVSLESIIKYDFGTEELAKNMNNKMNSCGIYDSSIECNSVSNAQYVNIDIKINEENLNNISEYTKYKNLNVNDILNKNITDNNIFNNQEMTCSEQK